MNPNLNKQAQADNKQFKQSYIRANTHSKYLCKIVEVTVHSE